MRPRYDGKMRQEEQGESWGVSEIRRYSREGEEIHEVITGVQGMTNKGTGKIIRNGNAAPKCKNLFDFVHTCFPVHLSSNLPIALPDLLSMNQGNDLILICQSYSYKSVFYNVSLELKRIEEICD